ncbi:MAG TPA: aminotransferase class I/II-fold pyridoxal phosphate-dependent enzyme [Dehalococcoidia bacterium]|nr:aminotransferase class I/II-fold pyridoxal phosphate-dependent enzyme [Dehalococcoidia bacterium]
MADLPASGIRRFFDLLSSMDGVISLGVGEPDFVTPWNIRDAAIRSIEEGHTHYTSNYGIPALRHALSRSIRRHYGIEYDPESEILITSGVSEGLDLALRVVLDPGDEVLVPDPAYVAYRPCVTLAGGVTVDVPTTMEHAFTLQIDDLERLVTDRTKALIINYPSNPTGAVMSREELMYVADFAARHDLFVISDEVYDRLVYGVGHTCFPSLPDMRHRTVLLGGFSKAYAMTGWRLGWIAAPAAVLEAAMKVHQYVMMSAPTPSQYAALEALEHGEEDVRGMLSEYERRRRVMVDGLNAIGLECFEPRGAFYAFPSVRSTGLDDETFAEQLLMEEKVAVVPGSAFGVHGAGHVRCCYATALPEIWEALERMQRFVRKVRGSS